MTTPRLWYSLVLLAIASVLAVMPAGAAESCPCQHLKCLFQLLKQRNALAVGYDKIAQLPDLAIKDDSGKAVDFIDMDQLTQAQRQAKLDEINSKKATYEKAENNLYEEVPAAPDCGKAVSATAKTNPVTCLIDNNALKAAQKALPCKELGALIAAHEKYHFMQCVMRKHPDNTLPYIWLTPAGVAKEEAEAYRREAKTISKLIDSCCG
ncbi:MAG TPA: hypothetical protein VN934_12285 [Candidatus Tumulicola sp.]|nr:hypothetical protein [Candidatus Tumulicola sp.]